jgi:hypothetical protein
VERSDAEVAQALLELVGDHVARALGKSGQQLVPVDAEVVEDARVAVRVDRPGPTRRR